MKLWAIDIDLKEDGPLVQTVRGAFPDATFHTVKSASFPAGLSDLAEADGVFTTPRVKFDRRLFAALSSCRGVSIVATGFEHVDLEAAEEAGIPVTNVRDYCSEDIADFVIAAIYTVNKPIVALAEEQKHPAGSAWGTALYKSVAHEWLPHRLEAQTLAVFGFGAIGRETARRAHALGMQVVIVSDHVDADELRALGFTLVSEAEALDAADFVSIHVAGTQANENRFNAAFFRRMKKTATFINTTRGFVVDEEALIAAVEEGEIARAVLDVVQNEPTPPDDPILHTPGIHVTPHISYLSAESLNALHVIAAENMVAMLQGKTPAALLRA